MNQKHDRDAFDHAEPIPTADVIDLFPAALPAFSEVDAPMGQPAAKGKSKRKIHPPTAHPTKFNGKPKDSPHYLDPVKRLEFIEAMTEDPELPNASLKAMIRILKHYNHCEGVARPGEDLIADKIKVARPTVSTALNKAAELGWVKILPTRIGNRNGPNHYVPVLEKAGLSFDKTRQSAVVSVGICEADCQDLPALTVGYCESSLSAKRDRNLDTGTQQENSEREPETPRGDAPLINRLEKDFEQFWEWYPHKTGKLAARKAFMALNGISGSVYDDVMNGLVIYRDHLKASGDYPASPAMWLQNERWTDKPAPVAKRRAPASRDNGAGMGRLAI